MLYDDHHPPHFHAKYGQYRISVEIKNRIVEGRFPPRALKAMLEWAELNVDDLCENWELASLHKVLKKLPPLE